MKRAFLLQASADLIEEIAIRLVPEGGDYSRNMVLFPGKRPGYFLRKKIAEREGKSFIPPTIVSMDEFVDGVVARTKGGSAGQTISALDAAAVLYEIHNSMPHRVEGGAGQTLDEFLPLGLCLVAELEELKIGRCAAATVRKEIGGLTFGGVHALAELYERLYAELERRGLQTRSMNYDAAAASQISEHLASFETVCVGGCFAQTNAEEQLLKSVSAFDRARFFYYAGPHIYTQLAKLSLEPQDLGEPKQSRTHFYRAPDRHGEVFALSALFRDGVVPLDQQTVIVTPVAAALPPLLHHPLAGLGDAEFNISLGVPVNTTPLFSLLDLLLRTAETTHRGQIHAPSYVALLRHPYVKNTLLGQRADVTRSLVHRLENEFSKGAVSRYFNLEELEQQKIIFEKSAAPFANDAEPVTPDDLRGLLRRIHDVFIRPFRDLASVGDMAAQCIQAIQFVAASSTARLHPLFQPHAQTIVESLDTLMRSLAANHRCSSTAAYGRLLRNHLESVETHFAGTPVRGMQVLGQLETRGLKFRHVVVLDANDDIIPGGVGAETLFIPQKIRKSLGLETLLDREHRSEYSFFTLLRGADEAHLFYVDDGKRERSRFIERLVWERQQEQESLREGGIIASVEYAISLSNERPAPIQKSPDVVRQLERHRFSATALDTYLACGRKFYFRHLLNLKESEEVDDEVEQAEIGKFVHAVLGELFRPAINRRVVQEDLSEQRVAEIFQRAFTQQFGNHGFANLVLIRERAEQRIGEFLREYQLPLIREQSVVIRDVEGNLELPWHGYQFSVRVDRIEERDGRVFILDFKTSQTDSKRKVRFDRLDLADRRTWRKSIGSVQLPLYAVLYSAVAGIPVSAVYPAYVYLGNARIETAVEQPLTDERSADGDLRIGQFLETLLQEVVDPNAPFLPPEKLEDECPRCPFTTICKTHWVQGWNG